MITNIFLSIFIMILGVVKAMLGAVNFVIPDTWTDSMDWFFSQGRWLQNIFPLDVLVNDALIVFGVMMSLWAIRKFLQFGAVIPFIGGMFERLGIVLPHHELDSTPRAIQMHQNFKKIMRRR